MLRKTSKTLWFFIILGVSRERHGLKTWDERGNGKHIHDSALAAWANAFKASSVVSASSSSLDAAVAACILHADVAAAASLAAALVSDVAAAVELAAALVSDVAALVADVAALVSLVAALVAEVAALVSEVWAAVTAPLKLPY